MKELLMKLYGVIRTIVDNSNLPESELATRVPRRIPAGEGIQPCRGPTGRGVLLYQE